MPLGFHKGEHLEEYYYSMVERLGFLDVHGHATVDNGSNNLTLFAAFGRRDNVDFDPTTMVHRCFAHVINLVAKDGIAHFGGPNTEALEDEEHQRQTDLQENGMRYGYVWSTI